MKLKRIGMCSIDITDVGSKFNHIHTCSNHSVQRNKFLSSEEFIEKQMKIEEIYEEKYKRSEKLKAERNKIREKFLREDKEKQKEKELEEYLRKERVKAKRKEIQQRIHQRRFLRAEEQKLVENNLFIL